METTNKTIERVREIAGKQRRIALLGFICDNDVTFGPVVWKLRDKYNVTGGFVEWLFRQGREVKQRFVNEFCGSDDAPQVRVCSRCGELMTEGYYLDGEYACSRSCAMSVLGWDEKEFDEKIEKAAGEVNSDIYYTEW